MLWYEKGLLRFMFLLRQSPECALPHLLSQGATLQYLEEGAFSSSCTCQKLEQSGQIFKATF